MKPIDFGRSTPPGPARSSVGQFEYQADITEVIIMPKLYSPQMSADVTSFRPAGAIPRTSRRTSRGKLVPVTPGRRLPDTREPIILVCPELYVVPVRRHDHDF